MLPEIEKIVKRKEKLIKKHQREALLLDNLVNIDGLAAGRFLHDRKPVLDGRTEERVEFLKKKRMELIAAKSSKPNRDSKAEVKKPDQDGSSSDDDDDNNESFTVDEGTTSVSGHSLCPVPVAAPTFSLARRFADIQCCDLDEQRS
ncbi:hypothetical protein Droror1_Dr00012297 [Drosera rotundifolia]